MSHFTLFFRLLLFFPPFTLFSPFPPFTLFSAFYPFFRFSAFYPFFRFSAFYPFFRFSAFYPFFRFSAFYPFFRFRFSVSVFPFPRFTLTPTNICLKYPQQCLLIIHQTRLSRSLRCRRYRVSVMERYRSITETR